MNITPRLVIEQILAIGSQYLGEYTFQDGTKGLAIGILGLRDQRVQSTEGCEVLVSPVANGDYLYEGGTHSYDQGWFEVRIIQHRSNVYHIAKVVEACSSFSHFGNVTYKDQDGVQSTPYALMQVGFSSMHLTNSETYEAGCSFTNNCPIS